ncbi:MAG: cytosine/creatinine deaminase [Hyphomicrobiales bacterium]|jgi:cytosine deaminase|nr:cytosine/creatinine deaminase [Hyphomicrobiales bacterium]
MSFLTIPQSLTHYCLANARVPVCLVADAAQLKADADGLAPCDIVIEKERIAAIGPGAAANDDLPRFDLDRGIVLPRLVDVHTHIDKGHIWARAQNPDGTHMGARTAVMADREANWSRDDVARRMDFALRCAFAHGTGALRTHIDSYPKQTPISWPLFAEMREEWKGRIALQAVSLYPIDMALNDEPNFRAMVETVAQHGGLLGGLTFLGEAPNAKTDAALDRIFKAAIANGLDLDFHVDESDSSKARSLGQIADAALRHKFKGRIVAGHCCSLALADDNERATIIAKVAEARIAIVSLPMCNMYLQDRQFGRTPRWRGVAPLHELAAAGVTVMVASDNTRDPFYAYGDLDMLEVYREATRILHFDHSDRPWLKAVAATSGEVMGLAHGRMAVGAPAGLVLTRARTMNELLSRPQTDRVVLCAGKQIDRTLPDYRELD